MSPKENQENIQGTVIPVEKSSKPNQEDTNENSIPKSLKKSQGSEENHESINSGLILKNALEDNQDNGHRSLIPRKTLEKTNVRDLALCNICDKKLHFVEKVCAEGKSFHRACFRCNYCNIQLR